ncbi:MAG: hypothetical protein ACYS1C_08845, partial [Planctomycetota bacterium]
REFLADLRRPGFFVRDQWQFQVQAHALRKVGQENLHFITDGLPADELRLLSVNGHAAEPGRAGEVAQEVLDELVGEASTVAVIPEGPYCAPVAGTS